MGCPKPTRPNDPILSEKTKKVLYMQYRCKKCKHEFESSAQEIRCKCRSRKVIRIIQPISENAKHVDSLVKTSTESSEEDQGDGSLMDITFNKMLRNCGLHQGRIELISHIFFSSSPYDLQGLNDLLTTAQVSESSRSLIIRYWKTIVRREIPEELMTEHEKWRRDRLIEMKHEKRNSEHVTREKSLDEIDNIPDMILYFMEKHVQFMQMMAMYKLQFDMMNSLSQQNTY